MHVDDVRPELPDCSTGRGDGERIDDLEERLGHRMAAGHGHEVGFAIGGGTGVAGEEFDFVTHAGQGAEKPLHVGFGSTAAWVPVGDLKDAHRSQGLSTGTRWPRSDDRSAARTAARLAQPSEASAPQSGSPRRALAKPSRASR